MGFKDKEPGKSESRLFKELMHYFESGIVDPEDKVHATNLPPIYFQHVGKSPADRSLAENTALTDTGHSMTIVGIERQITGHINLLVFDPMFHDAAPISKLVGQTFTERHPDKLLKPYRRGNHYLKKFREFEILRYDPGPVVGPPWFLCANADQDTQAERAIPRHPRIGTGGSGQAELVGQYGALYAAVATWEPREQALYGNISGHEGQEKSCVPIIIPTAKGLLGG